MNKALEGIKILYENHDILVINKPAGLLTHPDGSSDDLTLVDWIVKKYPQMEGVGETQVLKDGSEIARPGIVHRLDRDTSGVMLIAKTEDSYASLKQQFKDRVIKKAYLALVHDTFKDDKASGVIDLPIGRSPADFRRWSAQPGARGRMREAKTDYFLLEQVDDHALLFLQPHTGRTHQLRVHLKAIHHPIVGDGLYGPKKKGLAVLDRQGLHARAITWRNLENSLQQVTAPLPDDIQNALVELGFTYQSD